MMNNIQLKVFIIVVSSYEKMKIRMKNFTVTFTTTKAFAVYFTAYSYNQRNLFGEVASSLGYDHLLLRKCFSLHSKQSLNYDLYCYCLYCRDYFT